MKPSVTLFIPTLNEIDGVKQIMPQIRKEWCDQILVVDGGSTDGTVEYVKALGYDVYIQRKKGIRYAYTEGFPLIRGEIVISFSPDGNSIPGIIPQLIQKMGEGYDMVIASRYFDGAKSEDDGLLTAFGNWLFTWTIDRLYRSHYTDAMVMFRAYKKKIFYDLELDDEASYKSERLFKTIIGVEPLLSIRAAKQKLKVCDIPGDEPARIGGKRKLLPFRWGGALYLQVLRELYFWKKPTRNS